MLLLLKIIQKCWRVGTDIRCLNHLFIGTVTGNTYRGRRNDLNIDNREDIKKLILQLAARKDWNYLGTTAYEVANLCGISKEWARKILLEMEKDGLLWHKQFTQLKVYFTK
jgi:hypothetical protein